jgi:hypothetical protein
MKLSIFKLCFFIICANIEIKCSLLENTTASIDKRKIQYTEDIIKYNPQIQNEDCYRMDLIKKMSSFQMNGPLNDKKNIEEYLKIYCEVYGNFKKNIEEYYKRYKTTQGVFFTTFLESINHSVVSLLFPKEKIIEGLFSFDWIDMNSDMTQDEVETINKAIKKEVEFSKKILNATQTNENIFFHFYGCLYYVHALSYRNLYNEDEIVSLTEEPYVSIVISSEKPIYSTILPEPHETREFMQNIIKDKVVILKKFYEKLNEEDDRNSHIDALKTNIKSLLAINSSYDFEKMSIENMKSYLVDLNFDITLIAENLNILRDSGDMEFNEENPDSEEASSFSDNKKIIGVLLICIIIVGILGYVGNNNL